MSNATPLIGHWRPPQPPRVVFGALGVGKTYCARITQKRTTDKEDESRE